MSFILGFISGNNCLGLDIRDTGILPSGIEKRIKIIETRLGNAGPQVRGAIYLPEDESELTRKEIIERNKKRGEILI